MLVCSRGELPERSSPASKKDKRGLRKEEKKKKAEQQAAITEANSQAEHRTSIFAQQNESGAAPSGETNQEVTAGPQSIVQSDPEAATDEKTTQVPAASPESEQVDQSQSAAANEATQLTNANATPGSEQPTERSPTDNRLKPLADLNPFENGTPTLRTSSMRPPSVSELVAAGEGHKTLCMSLRTTSAWILKQCEVPGRVPDGMQESCAAWKLIQRQWSWVEGLRIGILRYLVWRCLKDAYDLLDSMEAEAALVASRSQEAEESNEEGDEEGQEGEDEREDEDEVEEEDKVDGGFGAVEDDVQYGEWPAKAVEAGLFSASPASAMSDSEPPSPPRYKRAGLRSRVMLKNPPEVADDSDSEDDSPKQEPPSDDDPDSDKREIPEDICPFLDCNNKDPDPASIKFFSVSDLVRWKISHHELISSMGSSSGWLIRRCKKASKSTPRMEELHAA
ncbi:uncharacterized protein LTR77_002088 [Saxophila tyrrhenica]|uniref:Uncharacterized protein n=1 Tax=Saxophila tyrrhenica TaxID=1690608 RepID=A0AAV9PHJ0_9PEZI|nr:hypothetical protein LTR77_002088 [Saxophila tyrrhenica]